jgi:hypothetical protein
MEEYPTSPAPSRGQFVYRWSVRGGFAIGLLGLAGGLLALVLGVIWDQTVSNVAAIWLAVAALAFGLIAIATRPDTAPPC